MGKAISQGNRRDKVFLMTKCCGRTAKDAQSHLEDSLRRLRTDHLDLWQFHEIVYDNDPDWIFASGGAIEYALKAKEQGKIRFLGFTGHKDPSIHLKMLDKPYPWATVQMPLNVMDSQFRSFQHKVLPVLNQRGIAPIGMKSLGGTGKIVSEAIVSIEEALRYVFSLPIATLVSGIDSEKVLEQNLKIVRDFKPMTAEEMAAVEDKVAALRRRRPIRAVQELEGLRRPVPSQAARVFDRDQLKIFTGSGVVQITTDLEERRPDRAPSTAFVARWRNFHLGRAIELSRQPEEIRRAAVRRGNRLSVRFPGQFAPLVHA